MSRLPRLFIVAVTDRITAVVFVAAFINLEYTSQLIAQKTIRRPESSPPKLYLPLGLLTVIFVRLLEKYMHRGKGRLKEPRPSEYKYPNSEIYIRGEGVVVDSTDSESFSTDEDGILTPESVEYGSDKVENPWEEEKFLEEFQWLQPYYL